MVSPTRRRPQGPGWVALREKDLTPAPSPAPLGPRGGSPTRASGHVLGVDLDVAGAQIASPDFRAIAPLANADVDGDPCRLPELARKLAQVRSNRLGAREEHLP